MSTELLLPLYFVLVPVILVAGVVLAIKTRHRLGPRASNQLAGGAALLLLQHLTGPLRVRLADAISHEGLFTRPDVLPVLSLLQLLAQAVGVGLIIAAVFSSRPVATNGTPADASPDRDQQLRSARI